MSEMAMSKEPLPLGLFELHHPIGRGGMGEVWSGIHREHQIPVAIKVITAESSCTEQSRRRFAREAEAMASMAHPKIVKVFDYGFVSASSPASARYPEGSPYLVMERGVGPLDTAHVQSWEALYRVLSDLLDALAYAHARDIHHRDLKPANILVVEEENGKVLLKLADFGLANAMRGAGLTGIPDSESAAGTPQYLAPEQVLGDWRGLGPWTDLYALGCLAFEMASGALPFKGDNVFELAMQHLKVPPPTLPLRYEVPSGFQRWVHRLLAKSPRVRYRRAADAANALRAMTPSHWPVLAYSVFLPKSRAKPPPLPTQSGAVERLPDPKVSEIDRALAHKAVSKLDADPAQTMRRSVVFNVSAFEIHALPPIGLAASLESTPRQRAPIPSTWRPRTMPAPSLKQQATALSMLTHTDAKMLGQVTARDRLWELLRRVNRSKEPHVVVIRSEAGAGKSQLVEWLLRRSHELGAATGWRARHNPVGGSHDGLPGTLEDLFSAWDLARAPTYQRVLQALCASEGVSLDEAEESRPQLLRDAALVTEMLRPHSEYPDDDVTPRAVFSGPRERHALIARLIEQSNRSRQVILWIDNAQWGHSSLSLVKYLMACQFPLMIVLTVRLEALDDARELEADGLEEIGQATNCETIDLPALSKRNQKRLVLSRLQLVPSLVDAIVERCDGHPLRMLRLIESLHRRDVLSLSPEGFCLRDASTPLPADPVEVARDEVERFLSQWSKNERHAVMLALEIAAALGLRVDQRDWLRACESALLRVPPELSEALIAVGVARRTRSGWRFRSHILRESLEETARCQGRWADHHRRCASMLRQSGAIESIEAKRRYALHLFEAGDWEEVLVPLTECIEHAFTFGEQGIAERLLDQHTAALEELDWAGREANVHNMYHRASLLRQRGEIASALAVLLGAVQVAWEGEWGVTLGRVLRLQGVIRNQKAQHDRARMRLEEALGYLIKANQPVDTVKTMNALARAQRNLGERDEAIALLRRAHDLCEEHDERSLGAQVLIQLARCVQESGDNTSARNTLEDAQALAKRAGDLRLEAHCWDGLGQLASEGGDVEEAQRCLSKAAETFSILGDFREDIERVYLATSSLRQGNYPKAKQLLERLLPAVERIHYHVAIAEASLGLSVCAAQARDWSAWERHFSRAQELSAKQEERRHALAWLSSKAGGEALAAGAFERAGEAYLLSLSLWEEIGDEEEITKLTFLLDGITQRRPEPP